jgi:FixJ family two-component response regulator
VEDDEDVRGYATLVLSRQGYRVYAHADGHSAIRAVEHLSEAPALLVTDVIMPDMNGKTLADRLTVRCPDLRVLFTSGYTENVIAHHGVLEPGVEFLQKPYSVEALVSRVREVLDTPRT